MKSFEPVYKELEELFIQQLPEYIQKINIEHNDGIILKSFQNTKLDEYCLKLPCFKFSIEESEYSEKDRIIENSAYNVSFEIKLPQNIKSSVIILWRYVETIQRMLTEKELDFKYKIMKLKLNRIYVKIDD